MNSEVSIIGRAGFNQANSKVNLVAFKHGQRFGGRGLDQLQPHVGIAFGISRQKCR